MSLFAYMYFLSIYLCDRCNVCISTHSSQTGTVLNLKSRLNVCSVFRDSNVLGYTIIVAYISLLWCKIRFFPWLIMLGIPRQCICSTFSWFTDYVWYEFDCCFILFVSWYSCAFDCHIFWTSPLFICNMLILCDMFTVCVCSSNSI